MNSIFNKSKWWVIAISLVVMGMRLYGNYKPDPKCDALGGTLLRAPEIKLCITTNKDESTKD